MQHTAMQKSLNRDIFERPAGGGSPRPVLLLYAVLSALLERSCAVCACLARAVRSDEISRLRASMRALSWIAVPQLLRLARPSASRHRAVKEAICASAWVCSVDNCSRRAFSWDRQLP